MKISDDELVIASNTRLTEDLLRKKFKVSESSPLYGMLSDMIKHIYDAATKVRYKASDYIAHYHIDKVAPDEAKKLMSYKYFYWGELTGRYDPHFKALQATEIEIDGKNFFMYKPYNL